MSPSPKRLLDSLETGGALRVCLLAGDILALEHLGEGLSFSSPDLPRAASSTFFAISPPRASLPCPMAAAWPSRGRISSSPKAAASSRFSAVRPVT